jgi:hypothetical protein
MIGDRRKNFCLTKSGVFWCLFLKNIGNSFHASENEVIKMEREEKQR